MIDGSLWVCVASRMMSESTGIPGGVHPMPCLYSAPLLTGSAHVVYPTIWMSCRPQESLMHFRCVGFQT
jgi:hypothetical protein